MVVWKRKAYRVVMGCLFPVAYLLAGSPELSLGLGCFFLTLLLALEWERRRSPAVYRFLLAHAGGVFKTQPGRLTGETYYMMAVVFSLLVFPKPVCVCHLFFLVFGDAGSAVVGTRWGRRRLLSGKTLEGTAGHFAANLCAGAALSPVTGIPFAVLAYVALFGAVIETVSTQVDDNLTVGTVPGFLLWWCVTPQDDATFALGRLLSRLFPVAAQTIIVAFLILAAVVLVLWLPLLIKGLVARRRGIPATALLSLASAWGVCAPALFKAVLVFLRIAFFE